MKLSRRSFVQSAAAVASLPLWGASAATLSPTFSPLAPGTIGRIEAPGSAESLPFERSRKGLVVRLPEGLAGSVAIVLEIRGNGLV